MKLESALELLLTPYMPRLQVRPGNGLTRSMNTTLRSYSELPLIIRRTVECLASLEYLFGFPGTAAVHYADLYQILINTYDDWVLEVPHLPSPTAPGPIIFVRKPRVSINRFTAAWTIARRINLLTGRGKVRLHSNALNKLRRLMSTTETRRYKGGESELGDRGPP
jgi:hypothetical protein